ncbi:MAG: AAA family ATPase [Chloroflexota bacterium]
MSQPDLAISRRLAALVRENVGRVVVGKGEAIDLALVALLAEGHVLIEDVPGIGKTTLAKAIARSLGCSFRRIQFTPDLLPADVLGVHFFDQKRGEFEYRPGPIYANVVLADEINRATPRTQSSLLEAMEERQVTADGETRPLPRPFLVLATQNPIELEGTFPLPEAQLDRFLLRLSLGYPTETEEHALLLRFERHNPLDDLAPVVGVSEVVAAQVACRTVHVAEPVRGYAVRLVRATREHPDVEVGGSPRATLGLYHAAQALASLRGRDFVLPDDLKTLFPPVMAHRLLLRPQARLRGRTATAILSELLETVPVPVEEMSL